MVWNDPEARRVYDWEWHKKNAKRRQEVQRQNKYRIRRKFIEFKKTLTCNRCGFSDYRALQFHHLYDKKKSISEMVTGCYSWENIMAEVDKCMVLCANCHSIEHYKI